MTRAGPSLDELSKRLHDSEVAELLGFNIRKFREVLDSTPRSHIKNGRQRYLLPRHIDVVIKAMENTPCRSNSSPQAKGKATNTSSRAGRSKASGLNEALKLASGA